jgi:PAS domain S-box-containing protein
LFISALISGIVAVYAWRRRPAPGATYLALLMLGATVWSLGYAVATGFGDLASRILWAKVQYPGIALVHIGLVLFVLEYTGRKRLLTRRNIVLLALVPSIAVLLAWTNEAHGLIWQEIQVVAHGSFYALELDYGTFFWLWTLYAYALLFIVTFLLLQAVFHSSPLQRRQSTILFTGMMLPWLGNFLYLSGLNPFPYLDLTPFFYSLSGLVLAWGLFHHRLLDIVPIARHKVLESMNDGVIVVDTQARIVDINPAALRLVRRSLNEALGQPVERILVERPDGLTERSLEYPSQGLTRIPVEPSRGVLETRVQLAFGQKQQRRYYDLHTSPINDRRGKLIGRLIVLSDITERRQSEVAMRRAKEAADEARRAAETANQARSTFLANMNHELRTPLNAILGFSELMVKDTNLTIEQRENLAAIVRGGERLLSLINDVLELSRIEAGRIELEPEDFDLHQLLFKMDKMFRLTAQQKGLGFGLERALGVPQYVHADKDKLQQVLINLLDNAVKFTHEGCVTLRAQCDDGHTVRFEVEDTGEGITLDELDTLFAPFVQDSSRQHPPYGTGLGLSISREFAHMMGSELMVYSEGVPGKGALFQFDVPVSIVDPPDVQPTKDAEHAREPEAPPAYTKDSSLEELSASDVVTLAHVPGEWLAQLQQATTEADIEQMLGLIEQLREQDRTVADMLAELTYSFDYTAIQALIDRAHTGET